MVLVGLFIHSLTQHRAVGQIFKIAAHLYTHKPRYRVEPKGGDKELRQQCIYRMPLRHVRLFVRQYLPKLQRRFIYGIYKYPTEEGKGTVIARQHVNRGAMQH